VELDHLLTQWPQPMVRPVRLRLHARSGFKSDLGFFDQERPEREEMAGEGWVAAGVSVRPTRSSSTNWISSPDAFCYPLIKKALERIDGYQLVRCAGSSTFSPIRIACPASGPSWSS